MYFSCREPPPYETYVVKAGTKISVKCSGNETHVHRIDQATLFMVKYDEFITCNITGGKLLGTVDCIPSSVHHFIKFDDVDLEEAETYYVVGK